MGLYPPDIGGFFVSKKGEIFMASTPSVSLPRTANGSDMQLTPAKTALAVTVDPTVSSSTEITLNAATTIIRCYATTQDVYLKWGTSDVTASNFDEVLPAGQIVDFVVPLDSNGVKYTAINLIERTATAAVVVIEK